jgi:hypothetical protein
MMRDLRAFQQNRNTKRFSHPGPPSSISAMQEFAGRKYGTARSIAGMPHFRPRRVRIASSAMLVGM